MTEPPFKFRQIFTGKRGDLPAVRVEFVDGAMIIWKVRRDFTGWTCSVDDDGGCDHTDTIEEILPQNLVKFFGYLEDQSDRGRLTPQRRSRE